MATKKKVSKKVAPKKRKDQTSQPASEGDVKRIQIHIGDSDFWINPSTAMQLMIVEAATKGASQREIRDFFERYRLAVDVFHSATGPGTIRLNADFFR